MSGIYIPDVGLPQDRDFELWIAVKKDGTFSYNVSGGWHNSDRVAIPVPEHGRLVDADTLDKTMQFIGEAEAQIYRGQSWGFATKCRRALCDAPTIIPADRFSDAAKR